jgi:hypothetical protein
MASEERDQLLANLRRLQLRHAANRIDDLLREAAQLKLGHLGLLARVVDTEVLGRNETATNRRIQEAHFPQPWRIEDYDFKEQPCLDRKGILDLAECEVVSNVELPHRTARKHSSRTPVTPHLCSSIGTVAIRRPQSISWRYRCYTLCCLKLTASFCLCHYWGRSPMASTIGSPPMATRGARASTRSACCRM